MNNIRINAYAKVNLSIDVLKRLETGYHQVEMVMQQIELHDEVFIRWFEDENLDGVKIVLKTNKYYLPTDDRNLAYKAAQFMTELYGKDKKGIIRIDICKNIPVAAGMAGGSSNGAAVIHGLNVLWGLNKNLDELCDVGARLGADVPFTLMGQAKANKSLGVEINRDKMATCCALATGIGTELKAIPSLKADILLSKPPISVSTPEVYKGMKLDEIIYRPDNNKLIQGLKRRDKKQVTDNMINVLEQYTLKAYDIVADTKTKMQEVCPNAKVLMSGSGPTIFGIVSSKEELEHGYEIMRKVNEETFKTRTLI